MTDRTPARLLRRRILALAAATVGTGLTAGLAGCATTDPLPFRPAQLQAEELDSAGGARFRRLPPPTTREGRLDVNEIARQTVEGGTDVDTGEIGPEPSTRPGSLPGTVGMSLQDAVRRATVNNYDVAVSAIGPAIEGARVTEALARFDPVFRQQFEFQYADSQITNFANGVNSAPLITDLQRTYTGSTSLIQPLPSGGEAQLSYNVTRANSPTNVDRGLSQLDTTWESEALLRFTQPLLRDFGADVNRARIVINQNSQQISVLDFRSTLEQTLLDVEQAYWNLYRAQQEVAIQEELLGLTIDALSRIQARGGTDVGEGQITEAQSSVAQRQSQLITARSAVARVSDQLKLLVNDPDLPVSGTTLVVATTEPVNTSLIFDLNDALAVALLHRPEIAQQLLRVRSASTALKVGQNNVLPSLDLVLTGGFQGLDDEYGGAVSEQFGFDNLTFGLGLQFEVPLGNREARAVERRALLQRLQAITQYAALIEQITFEVKDGQRQVSTNYALLDNARRRVEAARERVRIADVEIQNARDLPPELTFRQLRYLDELAAARSSESEQIARYNAALASYERSRGTLLRYNNIVLGETPDADLPRRLKTAMDLTADLPAR